MKYAVLSLILVASAAHADGFRCETSDGDLSIKVFNHVRAEEGTRNAAVMVLSDPRISDGNKTIARFKDIDETLTSVGATYTADVDFRFNDVGERGRNLAGTKLGMAKTVVVDVDYNYNQPLAEGEETTGTLTIVKRNGAEVKSKLDCTRYLKN